MTPSPKHEKSKSTVDLLLETYLRYIGRRFYRTGGYTLGSREEGAKGEPNNLYSLDFVKPIPDIAIEVIITSGGVDKLEKYRRWNVPEVWFYQKRQIFIYNLRSARYEQVTRSEFLYRFSMNLRFLRSPNPLLKGVGGFDSWHHLEKLVLPELDLDLFIRCLNMPDRYDATIAFSEALKQSNS